jgi:hypothetical protein
MIDLQEGRPDVFALLAAVVERAITAGFDRAKLQGACEVEENVVIALVSANGEQEGVSDPVGFRNPASDEVVSAARARAPGKISETTLLERSGQRAVSATSK